MGLWDSAGLLLCRGWALCEPGCNDTSSLALHLHPVPRLLASLLQAQLLALDLASASCFSSPRHGVLRFHGCPGSGAGPAEPSTGAAAGAEAGQGGQAPCAGVQLPGAGEGASEGVGGWEVIWGGQLGGALQAEKVNAWSWCPTSWSRGVSEWVGGSGKSSGQASSGHPLGQVASNLKLAGAAVMSTAAPLACGTPFGCGTCSLCVTLTVSVAPTVPAG